MFLQILDILFNCAQFCTFLSLLIYVDLIHPSNIRRKEITNMLNLYIYTFKTVQITIIKLNRYNSSSITSRVLLRHDRFQTVLL